MNIVKNILRCFFCSCLFLLNFFCTAYSHQLDEQDTGAPAKQRIYLAKSILSYGVDTTFCSEYKISAALNLAMLVTEKYELISNEEISEIIKELPEKYTAFDIAKNLEANGILVVKVEQLRNLLRAEISRINPESPENVITGEGYAMLHYFTDDEHRAIYDPSLLLALQRAFAVVESDSVLFEKQNAKPAPLLAICGIEFQKGENSEKWELFSDELIRSYEMTETIFEIISNSSDWVVLDIETRDHLYSLYNLYGVENNIRPAVSELAALSNFGVKKYITGQIIERSQSNDLEINLFLNEIQDAQVVTCNKVSEITNETDTKKILEILKELTKKMIFEGN